MKKLLFEFPLQCYGIHCIIFFSGIQVPLIKMFRDHFIRVSCTKVVLVTSVVICPLNWLCFIWKAFWAYFLAFWLYLRIVLTLELKILYQCLSNIYLAMRQTMLKEVPCHVRNDNISLLFSKRMTQNNYF